MNSSSTHSITVRYKAMAMMFSPWGSQGQSPCEHPQITV